MTITKTVSEIRLITFSFSALTELQNGETITTATMSGCPSGLNFTTPGISGGLVQTRVGGGSAGTLYTIECEITTSGGSTRIGTGQLSVISDC